MLSPTDDQKTEIVNRILDSPLFQNAPVDQKIMRDLLDANIKRIHLSEDDLKDALFPPKGPKPKRLGKIHSINKRLDEYYGTKGRFEVFRVNVIDNELRFSLHDKNWAAKLWSPYFVADSPSPDEPHFPNVAVVSQPLFFRHGRTYIRDIDINETEGRKDVADQLKIQAEQLIASFHYLSAGECEAVWAISRHFQLNGARLDFQTARREREIENLLTKQRVILIGSSRTSRYIQELQKNEKYPFQLTENAVTCADPNRQKVVTLTDEEQTDKSAYDKYAILIRRYDKDHAVTVIAANHGRCSQGAVGDYLTLSDPMRDFLIRLIDANPERREIPAHFQAIFRVSIAKERGETRILGTKLLGYYIVGQPSSYMLLKDAPAAGAKQASQTPQRLPKAGAPTPLNLAIRRPRPLARSGKSPPRA